jgi:hypothetical protein
MFKFIESRGGVVSGPYWTAPSWQIHGCKSYWTRDELLDLPFSKTLKKRITGLQMGTKLLVYSTGSYSSHSITLMTPQELLLIKDRDEALETVNIAKGELKAAAPKEFDAVKDAEKKLVAIRKLVNKAGLR